jgi:hypothetical protein
MVAYRRRCQVGIVGCEHRWQCRFMPDLNGVIPVRSMRGTSQVDQRSIARCRTDNQPSDTTRGDLPGGVGSGVSPGVGQMRLVVAGGCLTVMDVAIGAETRQERSKRRYQRTLFDGVAGLYQATWPGYPGHVVEFVVATAGLDTGSTVLEAGCGTGQLTEGLACFGYGLTVIDIGPSMIAAARQRLEGPAVSFQVSSKPRRTSPCGLDDLAQVHARYIAGHRRSITTCHREPLAKPPHQRSRHQARAIRHDLQCSLTPGTRLACSHASRGYYEA